MLRRHQRRADLFSRRTFDLTQVTGDERRDAPEIGEADVRNALARLLASNDLKTSPQLAAFLTYIVEEKLAGRGDTIKGYTIATEALGRDASFDPQMDPIVRVEATRLRRAIDRYYRAAGREDPVEIVIAKGAYVPQFIAHRPGGNGHALAPEDASSRAADAAPTSRTEPGAAALPSPFPTRRDRVLRVFAPGTAIVLAAALFVVIYFGPRQEPARVAITPPSVTQTATIPIGSPGAVALEPELPVVRVEPFVELGQRIDGTVSARNLTLRLRDALARFDEIIVVTGEASAAAATYQMPGKADGLNALPASAEGAPERPSPLSYVVTGWVEGHADATCTVSVTLATSVDGRVVWTRQFNGLKPDGESGLTETALVRQIATTIAQPYGVVLSDLRNRFPPSQHPQTRLACLLAAYEYWQTYAAADLSRARDCLEAAAAMAPPSTLVYANLAFINVEEHRTGFDKRPDKPPLERARAAAQEAVRIKPQSGRAEQAMLAVLFSLGQFEEGLKAGERAIEANPYDSDIIATVGARRIAAGDVDAGMRLVEEATAFNTVKPPWYDFALFVGAYLKGDLAAMQRYAELMKPGDYPFALIARAILAAQIGEQAKASEAVRRLVKMQPEFGQNTRAALARYGAAPQVIDKLVQGLAKAGLDAHG
jgi:tetratricopeptide (TPR) repeat protein